MAETTKRAVGGVLLILIAAAFWGALGPVAKVAFSEGIEPLAVAFWRAVVGWVFFVSHAAVRRAFRVRRRDVAILVVFALVSVSGFYASYQLAIRFGGAARASVLLYTAPAWVALMAAIFLGERIGPRTLVSILVAMAGVALISFSRAPGTVPGAGPSGSIQWAGITFGLIAGFTYALYYILGRRLLERYSPITIFSWILIIGALGLLPFVSLSVPTPRAAAALLFIGFVSTYGAFSVYAKGLMRLRSSQAAVVATMEPVVAAVLAYFFWQEDLGAAGYLGAVLVIAGVILQSARR
jgi:drug/metabolite transporter, DME family